jgi:hypothetical protein
LPPARLANGSRGIGILSRDRAAASDAFFNQYGRDPVVSGAEQGGVFEITVRANLDELLRTSSISEREGYPGFSRRISTTTITVFFSLASPMKAQTWQPSCGPELSDPIEFDQTKELNDFIKTFSIDERTRGHCRERMLSLIFGGAYQGEHNERT